MFTTRIIAIIGILTAAVLTPLPAVAGPEEVTAEATATPDRPPGYYIWHDEDGWHLRTHGPADQHMFTARLHTDGVFAAVAPVTLEEVDAYVIADGGQTLGIHFHTYDGWDGVDFRLWDGADCIRFRLELNGEPIGVDSIYLGPNAGRHPDHNPFRLFR